MVNPRDIGGNTEQEQTQFYTSMINKVTVDSGSTIEVHSYDDTGVLTVFTHHRFANQSDGGQIIPSSLFARLANQYFGINEQSVTNKSFRNVRLSGRLHYEP